jgi:hypothetical protein
VLSGEMNIEIDGEVFRAPAGSLRLRLLCTLHGLRAGFALTDAQVGEREALDILAAAPGLAARLPGQVIIGDKSYFGQSLVRSPLAYDH